jgi:hypothetical protein
MAVEVFANSPATNVTTGGTDAPATGAQETWTVQSSASFPAASAGLTQFHVTDPAAYSEIIAVTNVSGATWTVTRGAENTVPVSHLPDFQVVQVSTAGALTQLRSTDWLNAVTMSGADPSGVADSAAIIQAAVNAAADGQPVYLPRGTYKTSSPITLPAGSILLGDSSWDTSAFGDAGTVIKPSASFTGTSVLYMADSGSAQTQGSWIQDIGIDGSALTVTADGIRAFGPVVKVFIKDVVIASVTGWGINQLADSGVASGNQCPYSWRLQHVYFSGCAGGGANLPGHTDSTWTDVESIGCGNTSGHGFAITGAPSNSHFTNCRAEWTGTGDGFHLTGAWNTGTASGGFTMTGCSTDRNQQNGFYCNATGYAPVIATNCTFRRDGRNSKSGGGGYAGIQLSSASIPVFFSLVSVFPGTDDDGTGTNSPQYGVSFASSTYVQILSGYIQGATAGVNGTVSGSQLIAPNVIVASGATSGPSTQLTDWYRQSSGIMQSDNDIQLVSGWITAQRFNASGITGATAASRYVGAIASGTAPASGTFVTGDWMIVQTGGIIICTAGGTQGTWVSSASLALPLTGGTMSGAIAMGSNKITGLTNGSAAADAAAFGQILSNVASTGATGYTLVNGTGTIVSWTAPNDGNMHRVLIGGNLVVTSNETGGNISFSMTLPNGTSESGVIIPGAAAAGFYKVSSVGNGVFFIEANTTFSITQSSALSGGAAVGWFELWAS